MNPYLRRLNSFSPVTLAQVPVPGQQPGGMGGVPLQAIDAKATSPEKLKQEGLMQAPQSPSLGGPLTAGPTPTYVTDIPIRAEYRNIYGTKFGATYNPTTGAVSGGATIPIGKAEEGYKIGVEGSYTPGLMDAQGLTPPPGFGGMIRFSRTNPVDPKIFEEEGKEKFAIEAGINATPRRVPPQMALPVHVQQPGPQMFQNLLNGR